MSSFHKIRSICSNTKAQIYINKLGKLKKKKNYFICHPFTRSDQFASTTMSPKYKHVNSLPRPEYNSLGQSKTFLALQ